MKARLFGAVGFLLVGGGLFFPACADNESSIAIRAVLKPADDTCVVVVDKTSPQYFDGFIDVGLAREYSADLLVENQMVIRGDQTKLRTETAAVHIYAADVQIQDAGGASIVRRDGSSASFTVP